MSYAGVVLIILVCLTFYLLSSLPVDNETILYIGLSAFVSNIGILSIENQLNSSQLFILSRYSIINNILLQLLFDSTEMKERNVIITDDLLSQKEFQYTKYKNNFSSNNVLLREQLEISTITKNEQNWRKKKDLRNQKMKMEELNKKSMMLLTPKVLINKKSQVNKIMAMNILVVRVYFRYFTMYTFSKKSTSEDIMQKLDQLFILHDKLTDCVDNLNDMCGLQMQLVTLSIFVYVIFGLFSRYW